MLPKEGHSGKEVLWFPPPRTPRDLGLNRHSPGLIASERRRVFRGLRRTVPARGPAGEGAAPRGSRRFRRGRTRRPGKRDRRRARCRVRRTPTGRAPCPFRRRDIRGTTSRAPSRALSARCGSPPRRRDVAAETAASPEVRHSSDTATRHRRRSGFPQVRGSIADSRTSGDAGFGVFRRPGRARRTCRAGRRARSRCTSSR